MTQKKILAFSNMYHHGGEHVAAVGKCGHWSQTLRVSDN